MRRGQLCPDMKLTYPPPKSNPHSLQLLETFEEIIANAWWRFLQLRNFINPDHTLTSWGIGLGNGLEKLANHSDLWDPLYLGLELVRSKFLHHEDFSVKYTGGPMNGSGSSQIHGQTNYRCGEKTHSLYLSCRMFDIVDKNSVPVGGTFE
jgi:hypothetical protein